MRGHLDSGRSEGAQVVTGGEVAGNRGDFVAPTVLAKTNRDMKVVREEIFGPVVCVQPFEEDDLDGIARFANDTEYGLSASILTQSVAREHSLAKTVKAGTVWITARNWGDPAFPSGGYKQSGWGREMGREVMDLHTQTKAIGARLVRAGSGRSARLGDEPGEGIRVGPGGLDVEDDRGLVGVARL